MAGYWTPSEAAGFVVKCIPAQRCVGGKRSECSSGYHGYACGRCSKDHYIRGRFFRYHGACRRRTPRPYTDLKIPNDASRRDLPDATLGSAVAPRCSLSACSEELKNRYACGRCSKNHYIRGRLCVPCGPDYTVLLRYLALATFVP